MRLELCCIKMEKGVGNIPRLAARVISPQSFIKGLIAFWLKFLSWGR